jgi:hypothetical protein
MEETRMKPATMSIFALLFGSWLAAAAQQPATPKLQPGLIPPTKAANPTPAGGAEGKAQKNSIGKGALTMFAKEPVSFWQEQLTFSGGAVTTDFLYNAEIGVLYGYREDDFSCSNGQTAHGGVMQALYTSANKAGKPEGSGWWAVELSAGKCGAKESSVYGCKFDASGNATECGAATVHNFTGEIDVVAAP